MPIGGAQASPFDLLVGVPAGSRVLLTLPAQTGTDPKTGAVAIVTDQNGDEQCRHDDVGAAAGVLGGGAHLGQTRPIGIRRGGIGEPPVV